MKSSDRKVIAISNGLLRKAPFTKRKKRHDLLNSQPFPIAMNKERELINFKFLIVSASAENGASLQNDVTLF